ncbi:MAG: hypothetical protein Kow0088_14180 [Anaerolineales bacterium]
MHGLKKFANWGLIVFVVGLITFSLPRGAQAVETDPDGYLEKGQVIEDDLFISGERVVVDGEVQGDLYVAANTIVMNGIVHGSAFLAAQTIELNGTVEGSLYGASQSMTLAEEAHIARNLFYAGFALQARAGSKVGKDALFGGYQAVLDGQIQRDVLASVGALEVNGEIGRNVRVTVGDPEQGQGRSMSFYTTPGAPAMIPPGLRINASAKIGGTLTYSSPKEQTQAIKSQPAGGIIFKPIEATNQEAQTRSWRNSLLGKVGEYLIDRIREIVTLFVIGLVGIWLLPGYLKNWKERMQAEPLTCGLNGLLTVLVGYIGAGLAGLVLLAIGIFVGVLTLGGLSKTVLGIGLSTLGLALAIFSLVVTYVSKILVSLWIGEWLIERFAPQVGKKIALGLLIGIAIYVIVRSIPILGWVVGLLATLVGVGAIYLVVRDRIRPSSDLIASGAPLTTPD